MDLTHTLPASFPTYSGDEPARRTLVSIPANGFYAQEWTLGEHSGRAVDDLRRARAWLGADRYWRENLTHLGDLPPHGATAVIGVIRWEEGSGGPARVLATV